MPIIEMHLLEGRTTEQKDTMAAAVTKALVESLGVPAESVRILITEHHAQEGFYVGGVPPHKRHLSKPVLAEATQRESVA
jgi:4-oxalocrotonate tautomerase